MNYYAFSRELNYWREDQDKVDEQLRALDVRTVVPERVTVGGGSGYSAPVPVSIEDTLAELNRKAHRELDTHPAPDGCPEAGTAGPT